MAQQLYDATMDLFGETIIQPVPEEHREALLAAFAEAGGQVFATTDDCPICRALRAAGLSDADGCSGEAGANRGDRRALEAFARRAQRAARRQTH